MSQALVHDKDATEMGPGETVDSVGGAMCGEIEEVWREILYGS